MITMTINGKETALPESLQTMEDILTYYDLDPQAVVVERNGEIVAREQLAAVDAEEGDMLEIVEFVGGG